MATVSRPIDFFNQILGLTIKMWDGREMETIPSPNNYYATISWTIVRPLRKIKIQGLLIFNKKHTKQPLTFFEKKSKFLMVQRKFSWWSYDDTFNFLVGRDPIDIYSLLQLEEEEISSYHDKCHLATLQ